MMELRQVPLCVWRDNFGSSSEISNGRQPLFFFLFTSPNLASTEKRRPAEELAEMDARNKITAEMVSRRREISEKILFNIRKLHLMLVFLLLNDRFYLKRKKKGNFLRKTVMTVNWIQMVAMKMKTKTKTTKPCINFNRNSYVHS